MLLRTEGLTKSYGKLVVTSDVSIAVARGERHVIIGPNGAGKTSLLHQLGGQVRPSSGRIWLKDEDVTGFAPEEMCRRGVARTFQVNNLFRNLSMLENARLAVQARHGRPFDPFHRALADRHLLGRVEAVLAAAHLRAAFARPVRALSYGEQRQLELTLALASNPDVLLLDEPTSGMSPVETEAMIRLVRGLPPTLGLLMIEHDMKVVFGVADRVTVLYFGEVLATGTPDQIRADERVRAVYLGSVH